MLNNLEVSNTIFYDPYVCSDLMRDFNMAIMGQLRDDLILSEVITQYSYESEIKLRYISHVAARAQLGPCEVPKGRNKVSLI